MYPETQEDFNFVMKEKRQREPEPVEKCGTCEVGLVRSDCSGKFIADPNAVLVRRYADGVFNIHIGPQVIQFYFAVYVLKGCCGILKNVVAYLNLPPLGVLVGKIVREIDFILVVDRPQKIIRAQSEGEYGQVDRFDRFKFIFVG